MLEQVAGVRGITFERSNQTCSIKITLQDTPATVYCYPNALLRIAQAVYKKTYLKHAVPHYIE